ncbi:MAG: hypothetical protein ABWZ87_10830 [Aeromicrobium sp.]
MDPSRRTMLVWSTVLACVHGIVLAAGLLFAGLAALVVVLDEQEGGDDLDGLGTALGVMGLVVIAPVVLLAAALLAFVLRGRRRLVRHHVTGPLRRAAGASVVVPVVVLVASVVASLAISDSHGLWLTQVVALPCLAVLVSATAVLVSGRAAPAVLPNR